MNNSLRLLSLISTLRINLFILLIFLLLFISTLLFSSKTKADEVVIDKVYHPYVIANEREIEWRFVSSKTSENNRLAHLFGYGFSVFENVAFEIYLIAERDNAQDFDLQAYEFEARWMMTEQGQYWADWGMLFEIEKEKSENNYEATTGIIFEKEFGKSSLTMNLFAIQEWGQTLETDSSIEFRLKYRYRFLPQVQPAIELYTGDDFIGIGPAIMGVQRINGQEQIKWEAGFITEVSQSGSDHTLRVSVEYEF